MSAGPGADGPAFHKPVTPGLVAPPCGQIPIAISAGSGFKYLKEDRSLFAEIYRVEGEASLILEFFRAGFRRGHSILGPDLINTRWRPDPGERHQ